MAYIQCASCSEPFFLSGPKILTWTITRQLNSPEHSKMASHDEVHEDNNDEKDLDIAVGPISVSSTHRTEDDELNLAGALHKAFVFASTSSLILVSIQHGLPKQFMNALDASFSCLYSSSHSLYSSLKLCILKKATRLG
jgi:hypothetical protein